MHPYTFFVETLLLENKMYRDASRLLSLLLLFVYFWPYYPYLATSSIYLVTCLLGMSVSKSHAHLIVCMHSTMCPYVRLSVCLSVCLDHVNTMSMCAKHVVIMLVLIAHAHLRTCARARGGQEGVSETWSHETEKARAWAQTA